MTDFDSLVHISVFDSDLFSPNGKLHIHVYCKILILFSLFFKISLAVRRLI